MKKIEIFLTDEKLVASEKISGVWRVIFDLHCITGDDSSVIDSTVLGSFSIGRKYEDYTSKKYNVKMPYSMFYDGPRAIHATDHATIRSYIQSTGLNWFSTKGCVRIVLEGAKKLFAWSEILTSVYILK